MSKFSREHVVMNGKPAFYACIFDDLKKIALEYGWALGLHGSLASDMDIMAMPWTEDAKPVEEMIKALSDCFTESPFKEHHTIPYYGKPNNRVVYTISIWGDFYLDINVIQPNPTKEFNQETIEILTNLVKDKYSEYRNLWFISEYERKVRDIYIQQFEKVLEELQNY